MATLTREGLPMSAPSRYLGLRRNADSGYFVSEVDSRKMDSLRSTAVNPKFVEFTLSAGGLQKEATRCSIRCPDSKGSREWLMRGLPCLDHLGGSETGVLL
eukprot:760714-Hanusia_phi.AAC.7